MSLPGERPESYGIDDVVEMLIKADEMGIDISKGAEIEKFTLREIDILVNRKQ